jgi:flagellar basal body L-ring protein FlgH
VVVVVPITIIHEKVQLVKDSSQVMVIVAACVVCAIVLLGGLAYALYRLKSNRHPEEADSGDLGDQNHQSKRQLQAESQLSSDVNQQFDVDFEKQYHPDPSEIISKLMKNGGHQTKTSSYSDKRAKIQAGDNTNFAIEEDEDESDSSSDKRSRDNVGSFEVEEAGLGATQDHGILREIFTKVNENKMKDDTPQKDA